MRGDYKLVFICTLHRCLHYGVNLGVNINFASDKIQTRYVLKTVP